MDGSPTLVPDLDPKLNGTPLRQSGSLQEAALGKISGYAANPMPCGMNQVLRKPEGRRCLSALRSQSADLPIIGIHNLFVVDSEYDFVKDPTPSM